ncbi:hypothetical protein PRIPAC_90966 [Pristionchus pacificus]|uniref:Uncharacterized protein n=1 Tax=Pristionchus pacificus TaxID=54126 RepID=A0A2A6B6N5_PRIPA|nr:hypothetical protein PRIPAC_90966 [Pristionchus pacificus]|eukprot:PDM61521.1 hypothetical protein PRIPAC_50963 [Pristionchus pacificus]
MVRQQSRKKCPDWPRTLYSEAVCAACHEMWSNTFATFNADCNAERFRNDKFRKCLDHFTDRSEPVDNKFP